MTVGYFEEAVEARAGCVALFELFKEVASSVSRGGSPRLASIWFGLGFVLLLVVVVVCWWWPRSGLLRLGAFGPLEPLVSVVPFLCELGLLSSLGRRALGRLR